MDAAVANATAATNSLREANEQSTLALDAKELQSQSTDSPEDESPPDEKTEQLDEQSRPATRGR